MTGGRPAFFMPKAEGSVLLPFPYLYITYIITLFYSNDLIRKKGRIDGPRSGGTENARRRCPFFGHRAEPGGAWGYSRIFLGYKLKSGVGGYEAFSAFHGFLF